ncbi:MAG: hypothetical protein K0R24_295 [Gammaproteobacteria bacterium]|nr:hypothetical protein [Gammaproteobacteria bacterium]
MFLKKRQILIAGTHQIDIKITESRNRTDTVLPPPDFESGASTSSAIPAFLEGQYSKLKQGVN